MESASENAVMAGFSNYTSMSSESVSIEGIEDQKWTGSPVTLPDLKVIGPSIMGRAGDTSVYDPDQYTVTYANNIDPGTATVTITGAAKGAWNWNGLIGSVTRQFKIIKSGLETKPEPLPQNSITLPKGTTVTAGSGASKATYKVTGNNTVTFVKSRAAIIIPNYNGGDRIRSCLRSLMPQCSADMQVWVVDNGSTDGSDRTAEAFHGVHVLRLPENTGFTGAANAGLEKVRDAEYVILLNNDTVAGKHFIREMFAAMDRPPVRSCFCRFLHPDFWRRSCTFLLWDTERNI